MMMHTNIVMDLAKKVPYQDGDGSCSNAATGHAWEATASIDGGSWCGSRGEVMSLGQLCKPDLKLVVQLATENPKHHSPQQYQAGSLQQCHSCLNLSQPRAPPTQPWNQIIIRTLRCLCALL